MHSIIAQKKRILFFLLLFITVTVKSQQDQVNTKRLTVLQALKYTPGNQAYGKYLKTDALGNVFLDYATKDSIFLEGFLYGKETPGFKDSLLLYKAFHNHVWAGPASGSDSGKPSYRSLVLADLPAGILTSVPTWQQTLTAGSNLTANVNITSNDGISYNHTMASTGFGNTVITYSGQFGLNLQTQATNGSYLSRLSMGKSGTTLLMKNANTTLLSNLLLQPDLSGLEANDFSSGNTNKLWVPANNGSGGFQYLSELGLRYKFPRNKPDSGFILRATDTLGTLAWVSSSTGGSFPNTVTKYHTGYNTFGSLPDTARAAISLTNTGSGGATYNATTGVINVPQNSDSIISHNARINLKADSLGYMHKIYNLAESINGLKTFTGSLTSVQNLVLISGGQMYWTGRTVLNSPADGRIYITNNNGTTFDGVGLGPETSSFIRLTITSASLNIRLGDNSAYAATQSLYERFGTGSPEGVVTAPVSTIYHRTDGGTLTSIYFKESGSGNTGWVAK